MASRDLMSKEFDIILSFSIFFYSDWWDIFEAQHLLIGDEIV